MARNIMVRLAQPGQTDRMRLAATRIIDGRAIEGTSLEGRKHEAISLYRRMMGIRSTEHSFDCEETDDEPTPVPAPVESTLRRHVETEEERRIVRLGTAIGVGVANALQPPTTAKTDVHAPAANMPVVERQASSAETMSIRRRL
jgi:hypothetical protein